MTFVHRVFTQFQKLNFFANVKNCRFRKNKVCFPRFVISAWGMSIEVKKKQAIKTGPEPKCIQDT